MENTEILRRLKKAGYIYRAKLDNFEEIKIKAREIRNKKRMES